MAGAGKTDKHPQKSDGSSMSSATQLMTTGELLALPDDGIERELIRGGLREKPATRKRRLQARTEASIAGLIGHWLETAPGGTVYSGEVGCILRRDPDSTVGIDVAFLSSEQESAQADATTSLEGPPTLAVEILSPSDKHERITEKVDEYLNCGVELVWVVDPHFRTVTVHRRDAAPELFNENQNLIAEPHLPGFDVAVREIFA
jgi:Uma2 family endonuclease